MAKIVYPGKKCQTLEGDQVLSGLQVKGLVDPRFTLVKKDPKSGAVCQLRDDEIVAEKEVIYAEPKHDSG